MLGTEGHLGLRVDEPALAVARQGLDDRRTGVTPDVVEGVLRAQGQDEALVRLAPRLVEAPLHRQRLGTPGEGGHRGVIADPGAGERVIQLDAAHELRVGAREIPERQGHEALHLIRPDARHRVFRGLGGAQHLVGEGVSFVHAPGCDGRRAHTEEYAVELLRVAELRSELARAGELPRRLGRCVALGHHQRLCESGTQRQLAAAALPRGRQRLEGREAAREVLRRLGVRAAQEGSFAGLLPGRECSLRVAGLRVVVGEQLRVRGGELRESLGERPRGGAVQLASPALEQRPVGGVLHEGVLEGVAGVGREAAREEQLCVREPRQRLLERCVRERAHGAQ